MTKNNYSLKIGWLYPQLMSTYGDRGNIIVLTRRCEWRGIDVEILPIDTATTDQQLQSIDLLFGGGAQDREQEIVMKDLYKKGKTIKALIEKGMPALFVCGAPQLMGISYEPAEGKKIDGLGIFNMVSKHPGKKAQRLIGNVVAKTRESGDIVVGFENHGGRTYLEEGVSPFASVLKGFGNNGEDQTEGVVYKNAIGCYLHGPLLPKNPAIADTLIEKALQVKYKKTISLKSLDDELEKKAKSAIVTKVMVK